VIKYEVFQDGSEWIARSQNGKEAEGNTVAEALENLVREEIIEYNLATGRTCDKCENSTQDAGGNFSCTIDELFDDEGEQVAPGHTCEGYLGW